MLSIARFAPLLLLLTAPTVSAFVPQRLQQNNRPAVAVRSTTADDILTQTTATSQSTSSPSGPFGALRDLQGVAMSGLKGQALSWPTSAAEFPKATQIRSILPADSFEPDTLTSLSYLGVSMAATAACTWFGTAALSLLPPENILTLPFWMAYAAVTGTVAMGLWVLAHECGHGAFSKNKSLQDAVGFVLHSSMLVPYYSWQRSHAVHHQYTNHIELGETHVPELIEENEKSASLQLRKTFMSWFGADRGLQAWGVLQLFTHLVVGWPAYLLIGATGGYDRGMTNHFYPYPLQADQAKKELFPGNWKEKVYQSDVGIAVMVGALIAWAACNGIPQVMALYGGPLLVINAWLVTYTWLQHTDVDVPHFSKDDHTYVRGALHTLDRPYDKLDPWGIIDFLHHKIGTTHVAHHFDSTIPFYKAKAATEAIKENFSQYYLYDPTPIPQALWRVAKGCTAVEKRGDTWIWNNEGIEDKLSK